MHSSQSDTSRRSSGETTGPIAGGTVLSKDALKKHDAGSVPDIIHSEGVIRAEGTRSYYRAVAPLFNAGGQGSSGNATEFLEAGTPVSNGKLDRPVAEELGRIQRLHRPSPSNATPLERFMLLNPSQDPYHPDAERALSDMGIDYGSLEHLETRSTAARTLAVDVQPAKKRAVSDGQASRTTTGVRPGIKDTLLKRRADTPNSEGRYEKRPRDCGW